MSRMFTIMTLPIIVFVEACGDDKPMLLAAEFGELIHVESPNYPSPYPINADCQWHIKAYRGYHIGLTFIEYDLEL